MSTASSIPLGGMPGQEGDESNASETHQDATQDEKKQERGETRKLLALVKEATNDFQTAFRDGAGRTFVRVYVGRRLETLEVRKSTKSTFATWLTRTTYDYDGTVPSTNALENAVRLLESKAAGKPPQEAALRVARRGNSIYIDMADDLGRVIVVKPSGWDVVESTEAGEDSTAARQVPFYRPATMLPHPVPLHGMTPKTLDKLFAKLLPGVSVTHRPLILMWLLSTLRPGGPYPILALQASEGSGKSVTTDILQKMVDPSTVTRRNLSSRGEPSSIFRAASKAHILPFDNVSGQFSPDQSDALCQVSSGGVHASRALFTDDDEHLIRAVRPCIVNGIDASITRADLLSRSLLVELSPICEDGRRTEADMMKVFDELHAQLLGALLDALTVALTAEADTTRVAPKKLPRMADVAAFVLPAEHALGLAQGELEAALTLGIDDAAAAAWDANPLARAVLRLRDGMGVENVWEGTLEQLGYELNAIADRMDNTVRRSSAWPKGHTQLSSGLRRSRNLLARHGVTIETGIRVGHGGTRHTRLTFTQLADEQGADDDDISL